MVSQYMVRISESLHKDIENAFSEIIHTRWSIRESSWYPPTDLFETDDDYIVIVELPGVEISKVKINIDTHRVTLSGQRETLLSDTFSRHLFIESSHGPFYRAVDIPGTVKINEAHTKYEDGLLKIYLPKVNEPDLQ